MQRPFAIALALIVCAFLCAGQNIRAQMIPLTGAGGASHGRVVAGATWDPANKGAGLTLSAGNLTATQTASDGTNFAVRSTTSHASGKFYFEFNAIIGSSGGATVPIGFGTASAAVASSGYQIGVSDNFSIGVAGTGNVYYQGGVLTAVNPTDGGSSVVQQVAIDIGGQLIWFKNQSRNNNWNNNGSADPATGVGGVSISPSLSGALFIMACTFNLVNETTLNLAGPFMYTAPVGFGNW